MKAIRSLAPLLLVALILPGCTPSQSSVSVPVSDAITQAEAQAIWDGLALSFGEYDSTRAMSGQFDHRRSQIETAVLSSFDLRSLIESGFREDVRSRVAKIDPELLARVTGTGDYPAYMFADGGESGGDAPPSRDEIRTSLGTASSADLFSDLWAWTNQPDVSDEEAQAPPLKRPEVSIHAYDVLFDAVLNPALATTRTVAVEGTSTVLVTFRTRSTWDLGSSEMADWTNRYTAEMRDGRWVLVRIENLGDYAVTLAENDRDRAKDATDARTAKPGDAELKRHFTDGGIKWVGQDKQGLWYAAAVTSSYSDLKVRTAPDEWEWLTGSRDMGFAASEIPAEVAEQLEKAGLTVYR